MAVAARLTDIYDPIIDIDRPMTADEFLQIVDRLPYRAELVNGEVVVNSPSYRHQDVIGELYIRLREWVDAVPGRGACGFDVSTKLNDGDVYRPDLWWYSEWRQPSRDEVHFENLPDIAVEVLLPGNRHTDLGPKRDTYERLGLPELWTIDPLVGATLCRRSARDHPAFDVIVDIGLGDSLVSPQLPGFTVGLADLFR